ncbi:MAG: hypothetical protein KatS3mg058_4371 [Roseiflexus sp.]|nr:MAG: hypothetical protein KatS3mg058_4371 [Roseiflexus sp.]
MRFPRQLTTASRMTDPQGLPGLSKSFSPKQKRRLTIPEPSQADHWHSI